ncbi:hypothetical protein F4694_006604 [Bacillus niacini]|uniref:DUF4062 domain-containing protein n=1 Tax=Neobacillus niacini TaxID=86668 RepID=A0A852TRS0_9BACI|nr:hypothetical protein [Neobacillus niacini]
MVKFYIASSFKNIEKVRYVSKMLKVKDLSIHMIGL